MRYLNEVDLAGTEGTIEIPRGNYSQFMLRYAGTSQAAKTFDAEQPGVVFMQRAEKQGLLANFNLLHPLTDAVAGYPAQTAAAGGAYAYGALLLNSIPVAGAFSGWNAKFFKPDEGRLFLPAVSIVEVVTCIATLYGEPSLNPEIYNMKISQMTRTLASGTIQIEYSGNILGFFIGASATTQPTRIQVIRDDILAYDSADTPAIEETDLKARKEGASLAHKWIDLNPSNEINGIYSSHVLLQFIGGVGATSWLIMEAETSRDRLTLSVEHRARMLRDISNRKSAMGQPRPIFIQIPIKF